MRNQRKEKKLQARFIKGYGALRSEYIKYNSDSLISQIINYLYADFDLGSVEQLKKAPWVQILLVKWILVDTNYNKSKRECSSKEALKIMNLAWKLQSKARLPNEYPDVHLFMRSMAYQQFSYQRNFSLLEIGRQKLLFADLPLDHIFQKQFLMLFGLSIKEFLELSFVVAVKYTDNCKDTFNIHFFSSLEKAYSVEVIQNFLNSLSIEKPELRKLLIDNLPDSKMAVEFYKETPFLKYPLSKSGESFQCWYPTILFRCLETCVYDMLKRQNPSKFMNKFGLIFENYVARSIAMSNINHITEANIKPLVGDAKCVDFILMEAKGNIFVDAKGVEMADVAKVTHLPEIIKERLRDTVIKAIDQAYSSYNNLEIIKSKFIDLDPDLPPYIIVVTYKEHYLGSGDSFAKSIANEKIESIKRKYPGAEIPLKNMFFMTVIEFDHLCEAVRLGRTSICELFEQAKRDNEDPSTSKFIFDQHLAERGYQQNPMRLESATTEIFGNLENYLTTT